MPLKIIHKVIGVVIKDNKFLMSRHIGKDIWTSIGGKPEAGETEEQCLLREIKEEISCDARIIRKLGDFEDKAVFDDAKLKLSVYLVELEGEIKLSDPDCDALEFFDKDYKQRGIIFSPTIDSKVVPLCIQQGLLDW